MDLSQYPDADNEIAIKQAIARANALRQINAPQGQMIGNGGFQHYVAPHWSQQLAPVLGQVLARGEDRYASDMSKRQKEAQAKILGDYLQRRPQATPAQPAVPATQGSMEVPVNTETGERLHGPPANIVLPTPGSPAVPEKPASPDAIGAWGVEGLNLPGTAGEVAKQVAIDAFTKKPKEALEQETKMAKIQNELAIQKLKNAGAAEKQQLANLSMDKRTDALMAIGMDRNEATRYASDNTLYGSLFGSTLRHDSNMAGVEQRREAAAARNAKLAAGGNLSGSTAKALSEAMGSVDQQTELLDTFDPETMTGPYDYGYSQVNKTWLGNQLTSFLGETFGMNPDKGLAASNWWEKFKSFDNIERHKLFGSALTATEQQLWRSTTVSPNSSAAAIKQAIETRRKLTSLALERLTALSSMSKQEAVEYVKANGLKYDTSGHNAKAMLPQATGAAKPAASSAPRVQAAAPSTAQTQSLIDKYADK